jgi:hypothetical protein
MALGAFQASLNILIHYERFYNGFYAPYFHIQLLGCNTKITDKLKLNVFMHITCQRVSAWQCCMGGVAFLWERVNFGPRQNKNHPTDQDQIWQA